MRNFFMFLMILIVFLFLPDLSHPQDKVPSSGKAGIVEKALLGSYPQYSVPQKEGLPEIVIEDSRELDDPGKGPSFFVRQVKIDGNTIFDDQTLYPMVAVEEGMEMTLGVLSLMGQEVAAYYATHGYFLTRAYVPQQMIQDGVVTLVVVEGKVGDIRVTGNKKNKDKSFLRRFKKVKKEKVLKEQTLERVLLELNELLGVKVRSILKPGELPGTSDLILEVTETWPYFFSFDSDNFGSESTGPIRFGMNASVGNLLFLGDQISVRGVKSNLDQLFLQGSYLFPITDYGTNLKFSYTYSEFTLGTEKFAALKAGGDSTLINAEVIQSLHRSKNSRLNAKAGYDYRKFKNFSTFEKTDVTQGDVYLGLGGNLADGYLGRSFFDLRLQQGFSNKLDPIKNPHPRGMQEIFIVNANITRYQGTGFMNSYLILKTSGQYTSYRANQPDLYSLGGMGTVRGYSLAEVSGDNGYLMSMEYVLPFPWKLSLKIGKLTLDQVLSFTGFIDSGKVFVRNKLLGEKDNSITGGGGGLQINVPNVNKWLPLFSFSSSYAVPVHGSDPVDGSNGILYLGGLFSYSF